MPPNLNVMRPLIQVKSSLKRRWCFPSRCWLAAPTAVAVGEGQVDQILVAIGNVAQAELVLPVADILLRRIVILAPVIAARVEMIELGRAESLVPADPEHVAGL